jgi:hypothetical protein
MQGLLADSTTGSSVAVLVLSLPHPAKSPSDREENPKNILYFILSPFLPKTHVLGFCLLKKYQDGFEILREKKK